MDPDTVPIPLSGHIARALRALAEDPTQPAAARLTIQGTTPQEVLEFVATLAERRDGGTDAGGEWDSRREALPAEQEERLVLDGQPGALGTAGGRAYLMAADVLRTLTVADRLVLNGSADHLRSVLRTAAEACEQFGAAQRKGAQALERVAELEVLLTRVAAILEAEPLPIDGGSWAVFGISQDIRRVLERSTSGGIIRTFEEAV